MLVIVAQIAENMQLRIIYLMGRHYLYEIDYPE